MRLTLWFLTATLAACRPDFGLEGSIGETHALDFDHVEIYRQDSYLVVEYLRVSTSATEKLCKLVVDTTGLDLPDGGSFRLQGESFLDHVELQRATTANDAFPPARSGELDFSGIRFREGGDAAGDFQITFENQGSLSGWFSGSIEASS